MGKLSIKDKNTGNKLSIETKYLEMNKTITPEDFKYIRNTVRDIQDLRNKLSHGDVVFIKGYHEVNDGGGGIFIYDETIPKSGHDGGVIIDPDKDFPIDWINEELIDSWFNKVNNGNGVLERVFDSSINVKWFGAIGDGKFDNYLIFDFVLNNFNRVFIDKGVYYISQTLNIKNSVDILGNKRNSVINTYDSILLFEKNTIGIVFEDYRTDYINGRFIIKDNPDPILKANDSSITGLKITSKSSEYSGDSHAIFVKVPVCIENCYIEKFNGDGIRIVADTRSDDPLRLGNANHFHISNCRIVSCNNGLYTDGGDANAGIITKLDATSNLGYGIYDSSFLGNTYIACHTSNNRLGSYKADNPNARNVFIGCYEEGNQPPASILSPSLVVGGLISMNNPAIGSNKNNLYAERGFSFIQNNEYGSRVFNICSDIDNGDLIYLKDHNFITGFRLKQVIDGLIINNGNSRSDNQIFLKFTHSNSTNVGNRDADNNIFLLTKNMILGNQSNGRRIFFDSTYPITAKNYAVGDIILNNTDGSDSVLGWKCISVDYENDVSEWSEIGIIINKGENLNLSNLPTSDPGVAGQVWNDNGTLKISQG